MRLRWIGAMAALVAAMWTAAIAAWACTWPDQAQAQAVPPTYAAPAVTVAHGAHVDQQEAAAEIAAIVADPRGWRQDLGHLTVLIVQAGTWGTEPMPGVGARAYPAQRIAVISDEAWTRLGPRFAAAGGSLHDQRVWAVLHEIGHLLGRAHTECAGSGPAPVMRPAIYGLGDCAYSVWVHDHSGSTTSDRFLY